MAAQADPGPAPKANAKCQASESLDDLQEKVACFGVGVHACATAAIGVGAFAGMELWDTNLNKRIVNGAIEYAQLEEKEVARLQRQKLRAEKQLAKAIEDRRSAIYEKVNTKNPKARAEVLKKVDNALEAQTKAMAKIQEADRLLGRMDFFRKLRGPWIKNTQLGKMRMEMEDTNAKVRDLIRTKNGLELDAEEARLRGLVSGDTKAVEDQVNRLRSRARSMQGEIEELHQRQSTRIDSMFRTRTRWRLAKAAGFAALAGVGGYALHEFVKKKECEKTTGQFPDSIAKYMDLEADCRVTIPLEKAYDFLALPKEERDGLLRQYPFLCSAYGKFNDEINREVSTPMEIKHANCSENRYEATVVYNGHTYKHNFLLDRNNGTMKIVGAFIPGAEPESEGDGVYSFAIQVDSNQQMGNVNTRNLNFGLEDRGHQNVGYIKGTYLNDRNAFPPLTAEDAKDLRAITPVMSRRLFANVGEQVMAIQRYLPTLTSICEEVNKHTAMSNGSAKKEAPNSSVNGGAGPSASAPGTR